MAKMLLLDVKKQEVRKVEADSLKEYYKLLNCRCIDIVERKIHNGEESKYYYIICDDEGLLKNNIVSAIDLNNMQIALVGNLLICNMDEDGNEVSLSDEDIEFIKGSFTLIQCNKPNSIKFNLWKVLCLWM